MKDSSFVLAEYHPPTEPSAQVLYQAITAWLTKELHK